MGQPFLGEIRMFGGDFAPINWMMCSGQLLPISEYPDLFNLIGTTYGGDGQSTFGLPDLQGRIPLHQGTNFTIGQKAGEENHTLVLNEIPLHTHAVAAQTQFSTGSPSLAVYAGGGSDVYKAGAPSATMNNGMILPNSGSQPHNNLMPFLALTFIIAVVGIFPTRG
jgi:microcystin-dependent protein